MIDERSSMGAIGDMQAYLQFKAAQALGDAARSEGGAAGSMVGLGAGAGLGAALGQMVGQAVQPPSKPGSSRSAADDRIQQVKALGELRQAGVLTDAEFDAEKQRILRSE